MPSPTPIRERSQGKWLHGRLEALKKHADGVSIFMCWRTNTCGTRDLSQRGYGRISYTAPVPSISPCTFVKELLTPVATSEPENNPMNR